MMLPSLRSKKNIDLVLVLEEAFLCIVAIPDALKASQQ